jgi:hypothetical protein
LINVVMAAILPKFGIMQHFQFNIRQGGQGCESV